MTEQRVRTYPSCYTVSLLPESTIDHAAFALYVEYRGNNQWAVCRGRSCLNANGKWDYEMISSSREDEWLASHRFDLDMALSMAVAVAPHVEVNGVTAAVAVRALQGEA